MFFLWHSFSERFLHSNCIDVILERPPVFYLFAWIERISCRFILLRNSLNASMLQGAFRMLSILIVCHFWWRQHSPAQQSQAVWQQEQVQVQKSQLIPPEEQQVPLAVLSSSVRSLPCSIHTFWAGLGTRITYIHIHILLLERSCSCRKLRHDLWHAPLLLTF